MYGRGIRMVSKKLEKGQTYILYVENPNSQETQKVSVYNDLGHGMKDFQEAAGANAKVVVQIDKEERLRK